MKSIFLVIALALVASASFAAIEPVGRSTALKYDGTILAESLEQEFINVLNKSGGALTIGKVVAIDVSNDDGASVTTSVDPTKSPACMIAVSSCASNALCKCQVYGYTDDLLFDPTFGSATAGNPFYLSSYNAGYIQAISSPSASHIRGGIFYDASAATGAVEAFLNMK